SKEKYTPMTMLKELMGRGKSRYKKWDNAKFRYKFILRCLINPITSWKYFNGLCNLEHPREIIARCPILPAKIQRPYLYKGMRVRNRARTILEHYEFVQSFPDHHIRQILLSDRQFLLAHFEAKNCAQFDIFCEPCGYDREGELTRSLCFNGIALARLSFTFIRYEGSLVAFIAGLQGPCKGIGTGMIRDATKACHGLFPKRILYESFTIFMEKCGISEIYAVTERNHVYRQLRYFFQKKKTFLASYSEFWESIDGVQSHAMYHLPSQVPRRTPENIVSKKRAEYRNRYKLLDAIAQDIKRRMSISSIIYDSDK
ncbi:TPA: VirK/YbjX family protein, partial [Salmonella enterica subsp. enterica serovar Newport]